jgi:uncharacterized protein
MKVNKLHFKQLQSSIPSIDKTIIIYHGWGSTTESQIILGEKLAKLGFNIVIPEIIYHDSRQPLVNPFEKETMQNYFWKTIFHSIDEINDLLNCLKLSKEETILLGSSMGGFISSGVFFLHPGFAGLVNINGSSSFTAAENIFREMDSRPPLNKEQLAQFKQYDPKLNNINIKSPILFLHGENDQIVPITSQKDFYLDLLSLGEGNNIKFHTYENVNHTISNTMMEDIIKWLEKMYLSPLSK